MIPNFIIYIAPDNIEERAKIVKKLNEEEFAPMVSCAVPSKREIEGIRGIIFDQNYNGHIFEEFRGKISMIIWYNNDMDNKDLRKLIPFFEAKIKDNVYVFNHEDRLLEEFTKSNYITKEIEEPENKKIKT